MIKIIFFFRKIFNLLLIRFKRRTSPRSDNGLSGVPILFSIFESSYAFYVLRENILKFEN